MYPHQDHMKQVRLVLYLGTYYLLHSVFLKILWFLCLYLNLITNDNAGPRPDTTDHKISLI